MLARPNRMTSPADFAQTIKRGQKARSGSLVTYVLVPTGPGEKDRRGPAQSSSKDRTTGCTRVPVRVGLVVNRRVANSVGRHRIARVLRVEMRRRLDSLPAGTSVVIRVLPGCAGRSNPQICEDLATVLQKLRFPDQSGSRVSVAASGNLR